MKTRQKQVFRTSTFPVFTKDDNLQPPLDMGPSPYPEMSNIEINCEGIANELDPSKSHGPDDVTARFY